MSTDLRVPSGWTQHTQSHRPFGGGKRWEPLGREFSVSDDPHLARHTLLWTSRGHRKGILPHPVEKKTGVEEGEEGEKPCPKIRRSKVRWWGWDWKDISWWIAFLFTLGSVFWCINGILFFCYFNNTSAAFTNTESATAFLGGSSFLVGGYLGFVEALNPVDSTECEWVRDEASGELVQGEGAKGRPLGHDRKHFGSHKATRLTHHASSSEHSLPSTVDSSNARVWKWWGTYPSLGWLANAIQLFGAVAFEISVICGLPGVLPASGAEGGPEQEGATEAKWIAAYWAMQVIGAPCFIIAGGMFCYEVQRKWCLPAPLKLGWQIGFWNVVGGLGFWGSGIFGIFRQSSISDATRYQYWGTAFSTFWGSWAFLLGSYLQLFETLNKRS